MVDLYLSTLKINLSPEREFNNTLNASTFNYFLKMFFHKVEFILSDLSCWNVANVPPVPRDGCSNTGGKVETKVKLDNGYDKD